MINGHTLRLLRQQKGLTQKQAAQRMGISQQAFSRLEHSAWLQGEKLQALLTACNAPPPMWKKPCPC
jgi:transcriptional regulator with XRE-family HTH domain